MKMKMWMISAALLAAATLQARSRELRVEPPCWWTGMKTELQLMLYGENLRGAQVRTSDERLRITAVHEADSPNYLFVDVAVPADLPAGEYSFSVKPLKGRAYSFDYPISARREGSAGRVGYGQDDVVYLLMPDRFANGDPTNDSTDDTAEKADRTRNGSRHGGDLEGIRLHLDYIADLGATVVWPTPLLLDNEPTGSYHGYACADYYRVDPRFGTNELYRQVVAEAHGKGLKFIQDVVPNHCGTAHWWMKDLPFRDWIHTFDEFTRSNFALSTHSDPYASEYDRRLNISGWFDTSMPDMNLANPYLLQYFVQWAVWWIEYADLDGLRVDTYPYSDKHRIAEWTSRILSEYPNLTIVGECWVNSPAEVAYWEAGHPNADGYSSALTMVMDFPLQASLTAALKDNAQDPGWGEGIRRVYNTVGMDYVYADPFRLLTFISNHDTPRPAHEFGGRADRMMNAATLLLTLRGIPQWYVGDELMFRSADGTVGHPQERIDFPGGWPDDRVSLFDASGRTPEQQQVYEHTRRLMQWRKTSLAVRRGSLRHFLPEHNAYVYFREYEDELVMVAVNNADRPYTVNWDIFAEIFGTEARSGKDILSGRTVTTGEKLEIPACSSAVIAF